jgi:hypothetical protein
VYRCYGDESPAQGHQQGVARFRFREVIMALVLAGPPQGYEIRTHERIFTSAFRSGDLIS